MSELPKLPLLKEYVEETPYGHGMTMAQIADYETALRKYWEARCRLAVETLQSIKNNEEGGSDTRCAEEALAAIGELPNADR